MTTIKIPVELKTPHPKQQEFLDNRRRFNALKCGRRFGKTELCQELISEIIERGESVSYFSPTYKDLYEVWMEVKQVFYPIIITVSETVKQITFMGGAKLDMWSIEDPDSGRGRKYHRAIVDECEKAGKFQEAWEQTIRATLVDYMGDAYFLSTPKFGDTYFKRLCKNELEHPDWKTFVYTTYDNPYIDTDEIEEARKLLLPSIFNCEYLAMDEDAKALNPFAHQFDSEYHVSDVPRHLPGQQLIICVDFNLNPFAVTFWHFIHNHEGYHLWGIDEAEIKQGSIPAMAELIRSKYEHALHSCIITGDAMGKQGQIALRDNASHYMTLRRDLRLGAHQIRVPANPTHQNSRADVNYVLFEAKKSPTDLHFLLSKSSMPRTIQDFKIVQCDAMGSIVKRDRNDLSQRADYMDTGRYVINTFFRPIILKRKGQNRISYTEQPKINISLTP